MAKIGKFVPKTDAKGKTGKFVEKVKAKFKQKTRGNKFV